MKEYKILGLKVNLIAEYQLKNKLAEFINSDKAHQIITLNPEFIVNAQKNEKFFNIINQASLSLIDGGGIIKALQYLGHDVSLDDRITGVTLNKILIDLSLSHNLKILFCLYSQGLTKKDKFKNLMKDKYPNLNFEVADENNSLEIANAFLPALILVGYGAPYQDIWIADNINKMPSVKIAAGVGGTFDFMSGTIKRAPKIMQSLSLEWLWRLLLQPKRAIRIARAVIVFPYMVFKNKEHKYA